MDNVLAARVVLFVLMLGAGALLIWMARAAASGRLKRNHLAGIRIPSTMASDQAWEAAHVRAERPTRYAGFASIATAAFALLPLSEPVLGGGVVLGCAVMIAFVLYGALVGGRAAKKLGEGSDPLR